MPLTDIEVRNAKRKDKTYRLADEKGMYLEVSPTGARYWRFKYRHLGKEKRLAFGVYPEVGIKDARSKRDAARKLIADGIDPSAAKKAAKSAALINASNTFQLTATEWFAKNKISWADSHADRIIDRLKRDVFPWIGNRPIADITAPELLTVLRRIEDRGANETAHRVLQNCSQVFRYAIATGRTKYDPTTGLKGALAAANPTHFAAVTEPKKVAELLKVFDGYEGTLSVKSALRLAPLVFVRPGELRSAKWADIDLANAEWKFVATKTGTPHIVPLSTQAIAILTELQSLTGAGTYVFPSARSASRPMSDNAILAAMRRLGIGKDEMSGHGFRAMARTILDEVLGVRPDLIEHQLAHAVKDPNGRAYNRTAHLPERRKMMQQWADYLEGLVASTV